MPSEIQDNKSLYKPRNTKQSWVNAYTDLPEASKSKRRKEAASTSPTKTSQDNKIWGVKKESRTALVQEAAFQHLLLGSVHFKEGEDVISKYSPQNSQIQRLFTCDDDTLALEHASIVNSISIASVYK